jgi:hypothetical protein
MHRPVRADIHTGKTDRYPDSHPDGVGHSYSYSYTSLDTNRHSDLLANTRAA